MVLAADGRRICGTPGCNLPDFHKGPCAGWAPKKPLAHGVQRTAPGSWAARSSSTSIERTADGVRVVITEDDGDGPETRVFEGSSLEDLLRDHPELEGRIR